MQATLARAQTSGRATAPIRWLLACCLVCAVPASMAQEEAPPVHADVPQSAVKGGGGRSSGGNFEVSGTIAVNDADPSVASAAAFTVEGGFFIVNEGGGAAAEHIFKDAFE